jgi:hypothetical protein
MVFVKCILYRFKLKRSTACMTTKLLIRICVGGYVSVKDLNNYKARFSPALSLSVGDRTVYTPPLPSCGVLVGLMMRILQGGSSFVIIRGDRTVYTPLFPVDLMMRI